jgi:FlaA1/EpsC-like NDP-sugar epimerase
MLIGLSRSRKRLILALTDMALVAVAFWAAFALRYSEIWPERPLQPVRALFVLLPVAAVLVYWRLGFYRPLLRSIGRRAVSALLKGTALIAFIPAVWAYFFPSILVPRSVPIIFAIVCFALIAGSRFLGQGYFLWMLRQLGSTEPVIIYGAGIAGTQLLQALRSGPEFDPVAFVDDDVSLQGSDIDGRKVFSPDAIPSLIAQTGASRILLAMPTISAKRRREILARLGGYGARVQSVPTAAEIVSGFAPIDALREIAVGDLLARDAVDPMLELLSEAVAEKSVLVTGAGGSIGAELCRQILTLSPRRLVLLEASEYALYEIHNELKELARQGEGSVPVFPVLGSVCDEQRLAQIVRQFSVDTIYHAAAYKHVPLVEHNVLEGLRNNVLGSEAVARIGGEQRVGRVVLVSTDKAVRPTSIMGASKRWAELVFQDAQAQWPATRYCSVRFGNVMGSSGSVIPLFEKQIKRGGPVTVTHPDVTRYFMTVAEAAQLVIQASSMGEAGDIFVLDMGVPVKIEDVARRMISVHGLTVRDRQNPGGDIEIAYTGLRPGEKLTEELLIGDDPRPTRHPKIMRAREISVGSRELAQAGAELRAHIEAGRVQAAVELLARTVGEYQGGGRPPDLLGDDERVPAREQRRRIEPEHRVAKPAPPPPAHRSLN